MSSGFGEAQAADKKIKELTNEVKLKVEKALGLSFSEFDAIKYRVKTTPDGLNYKIKVQVGGRKYVHIQIFVPAPGKKGKIQLLEQAGNKNLEDAL